MGTLYYVHRLPSDLAVDLLCVRRRFQDMDHEDFLGPYQRYREPLQTEVPRTINFISGYTNIDLAMIAGPEAGGVASNLWDWFRNKESDNPRIWSTRGACLVGWHALDLPLIPGATGFPYRYSLSEDICTIQKTLQDVTVVELRDNLTACLKRDLVRLDGVSYMSQQKIVDEIPPRLLETLRAFYAEAAAAGEIVIYNLR